MIILRLMLNQVFLTVGIYFLLLFEPFVPRQTTLKSVPLSLCAQGLGLFSNSVLLAAVFRYFTNSEGIVDFAYSFSKFLPWVMIFVAISSF